MTSHVPGKEGLTSTLGSQQLNHVAALSNTFISCTVPDKILGVRPLDTFIVESPWAVTPGAYLGKLFLVYTVVK